MATAAVVGVEDERLDVGWVVRGTVRVLRRRALGLLIVGALFIVLPEMLAGFLPDNVSRGANLALSFPALLFDGAAALIAYGELSGRSIRAGAAIRAAAGRFMSLWGVGFLSGAAVLLGALLFIVPGLIALSGFMCATTVCMVENLRADAALDRSWRLSKGSRWRLLGLAGLGLAAVALIVTVYFGVALALMNLLDDATATALVTFLIGPLMGLAFYAVTSVGPTVAYAGLRQAREGSVGDIATVFD
jgi:hypothetical protein